MRILAAALLALLAMALPAKAALNTVVCAPIQGFAAISRSITNPSTGNTYHLSGRGCALVSNSSDLQYFAMQGIVPPVNTVSLFSFEEALVGEGTCYECDVQVFLWPGYWVKPNNVKMVHVFGCGAGGGGGGGARTGAGHNASGGGGGGGGECHEVSFKAEDLSSTVYITIGVGGNASCAHCVPASLIGRGFGGTVDDEQGTLGAAGTNSVFGDTNLFDRSGPGETPPTSPAYAVFYEGSAGSGGYPDVTPFVSANYSAGAGGAGAFARGAHATTTDVPPKPFAGPGGAGGGGNGGLGAVGGRAAAYVGGGCGGSGGLATGVATDGTDCPSGGAGGASGGGISTGVVARAGGKGAATVGCSQAHTGAAVGTSGTFLNWGGGHTADYSYHIGCGGEGGGGALGALNNPGAGGDGDTASGGGGGGSVCTYGNANCASKNGGPGGAGGNGIIIVISR